MKPWFIDAMTVVLHNKQRLVEERLLGFGAGDAVSTVLRSLPDRQGRAWTP
jgi:hypothetical protein